MTLDEKLGQLFQSRAGSEAPTGPETRKPFDDLISEIRAGRVGSLLSPHGAAHTNALQRIAVNESRLHIPLLIANDIIHGYRTIYPVPLAEAATWRPEIAQADARMAAAESRAEGTHWVYAPMVDVCRDPRWGRMVETSGEDPFLGAVMAAAKVHGFQGPDLARPDAVMACAKHFVAYGFPEGGRDYGTVDMSLETLHEGPLRPFLAAARGRGPGAVGSIMTSFNEINGVPASGNTYTLRQVLRESWGWNGVVVSDWESVREMIPHGFAADERDAARLGLRAGVDVEMTSRTYREHAASLLQSGDINAGMIDAAVRRVLEAKERLGLFERPYTDESLAAGVVLSPAHRDQARESARRSFVLLKNGREGHDEVLPLPLRAGSLDTPRRLALIGSLADDARATMGTWAGFGQAEDVTTIAAALDKEAGFSVIPVRGSGVGKSAARDLAEVREAAGESDIIVAVVGENEEMNGEGHSRADVTIPAAQVAMLRAAREAADRSDRRTPRRADGVARTPLIVLVMTGRPLALTNIMDLADAVLVIWHPGTEGGPAVADTLMGRSNASGRLPVSFPRTAGQVPVHYDHKSTGRPHKAGERYVNGYLDESNEPLFPFGFGLSYTTFRYGPPKTSGGLSTNGQLEVSMDVTNTGVLAGATVAQLYFQDPIASRTRPVRQLLAFEALDLRPQETRTVSWTIAAEQLAFYSAAPGGPDEGWVVEPGEIRLFAGGDSSAAAMTSIQVIGPRRTHVPAPSP